jgi:hypothetical protein
MSCEPDKHSWSANRGGFVACSICNEFHPDVTPDQIKQALLNEKHPENMRLPPDPPLPSALSPGDRETLTALVGVIDRHTEAVVRVAEALEKVARAHTHLADRAREWAERNLKWGQG